MFVLSSLACCLRWSRRLPASGEVFDVKVGDDCTVSMQWTGRHLELVRVVPAGQWSTLCRSLLAGGNIGDSFVRLAEKLTRPRKIPSYVHLVEAIFKNLKQRVAVSLEASADDVVWDNTRLCDVPSLYKTGSIKARRVGMGYVLDVVDAVSTTPELRTPQQLLAVKCAMVSVRQKRSAKANIKFLRGQGALAPKSGQNYIMKRMCSYQKALRNKLERSVYVSITLDATRVAGADWCLYAVTDPSSGFAGWLPPQASAITSERQSWKRFCHDTFRL